MSTKAKVWSIILAILIIGGGIFFYIRYYFVFGEGVKAGELNYCTYKGYIFKTYEGKLIQSGFKKGTAGTIQSYEFKFSVENKAVADSLMRCSGKNVELHYKEYIAPIVWRGVSEFVVDSIMSVN
ncbi:MAG: hypothetical protein MJ003_01890 [Paludibacteraceae bacterium]|nr:hypothetical protein [Paludibacteraceae bacterium]